MPRWSGILESPAIINISYQPYVGSDGPRSIETGPALDDSVLGYRLSVKQSVIIRLVVALHSID